jgi:Anti-sigma factor NepR
MQTDAPIRKSGGRLSREDQRRLGNILQRVYDDVVRQGVPDRFRDLLNELDDRIDSETTGAENASSPRQGESGHESEPGRVAEANPGSKGSH